MDNLDRLFYWRGIANDYFNFRGERVSVPLDNRIRLLEAMGVNVESQEAINDQAYAFDIEPWQSWLAPFLTAEEGPVTQFEINLPPEYLRQEFTYSLCLENGARREGVFVPEQWAETGDYAHAGIRYSRRVIALADVPIGYHTLEVAPSADAEQRVQAQFVVVPMKAYTDSWVTEGRRPWGIIVQLYTLRSARNWGIGDFSDLKLLIAEAAAAGADMIGLNPLHALRSPIENHCSPYSPSDRRFLNPLYIDPEIEPEYSEDGNDLLPTLVRLRAKSKVPYAEVCDIKLGVLKKMHTRFIAHELKRNSSRAQQFHRFVDAGGQALADFCLYQVLDEQTPLRIEQLNNEQLQQARSEHAEAIAFESYLQWLANGQLQACQQHATTLGMKVGLMRDLAVGADGGGAEVSTNMQLFCRSAAVGAPPDPLAEKGQNWGLPPMDPATLRATGFAHYITLLRSNMAHCGALRIDHAMALMRLWWCPPGQTADFGAYVYYPFREMLGLLKLESVRNQCMVIGEDMGVVPPEFRQSLVDGDIFTNKLFYFEKQDDESFRPPEDYMPHSLAMLTNHDVPTIASWWIGSDLQLRQSLNLLEDGVSYEDVLVQRDLEKVRLLEWLEKLGLVKREQFPTLVAEPMRQTFIAALLHGVSQVGSQLFVVQLEDLELLEEPVNVPGTSYQYANWQRKLGVPLEMLFSEERVQTLLRAIAMERS